MELQPFIDAFAANKDTIRNMVIGLTDEQVRWKPAGGCWSILEVVNHLYDEEREDFRKRLDLTLHHPGTPWPLIKSEEWCVERSYNSRDREQSLKDFVSERERSLVWLSELGAVDWNASYPHPTAGTLTAGDLLTAWLSHDYLHMRQMVRLLYDWTQQLARPFHSRYASEDGW